MDSQGNLLVCGWFTGQATFGGTSLTAAGSMDIFVGKLSSSGSWLWVKQAGGTASCEATGIAVDANNEIYVCGVLNGTAILDIPAIHSGETDVFVSKLSTDGDWLWAERGGGANLDAARDIDVVRMEAFMWLAAFMEPPLLVIILSPVQTPAATSL
jgi:hypothetical protein